MWRLRTIVPRLLVTCCVLLGATAAVAHPHILATMKVAVLYSATGSITALRQSWSYDPAYSAFAKQQNFKSHDGRLSDAELSSLAETQIHSLAEFGYFTNVKANDEAIELGPAQDYGFSDQNGVLTLTFTQSLKAPAKQNGKLSVEIHDPHFFAYFTWPAADAARLDGAPDGCAAVTSGPQPLDLSQPRAIPAIFWAALDGSADAGRQFVNRLVVTCP